MVFIKKVINPADTGTADIVGGVDWDKLDDVFDNVATGLTAEINTSFSFRDGMFKLRNAANTFDTTVKSGAIGANRNLTLPLLTADDTAVTQALAQTLTSKTIDVETNIIKSRLHTYVIFKDGSTYYSQKYDGTINSNADFKTVFQAIIDSIPTRDDTVFTSIKIAPGTYDVNTTITIADKYNLSIQGSGMGITRIQAGPSLSSTGQIWTFTGSVSGVGKVLTSNTTSKSNTAVMSSGDAATFAANDWVLVRSNVDFAVGGSASGHQGEIKQIASISSGTITFREPIFDVYTTANGANIIKLLPGRNISFADFTLSRHASYTATNTEWWYCRFCDRVSVTRCEVVDFPGQYAGAMDFKSCINVKVSDCHMQQNIAYNFQYGISFSECCQNCVVSNCTSVGDWRHPFEAGSGGTSVNDEGVCRNIKFVNCTATGGSQNCFDSHSEGEGIHFINCGVLGTHDGGGIKLRSRRSSAIGCWVMNAQAPVSLQDAIMLNTSASDCLISNCHVINCSSDGIKVSDGLDGIIIEGCVIDNCTGNGILIETGGAFRTCIRNNIVINCTADGVDLDDVNNAIITGNLIRSNGGYGINFSAGNCTNNVITSNSFSVNLSGSKNNGGQTGCVEASNFGY